MKRAKFKYSEADMARVVVADLRELGWTVYQEVQLERYGKCADIVAVQNNRVWVVECKLSLSLDLLDQAWFWTHYGHFVSVAVPWKRERNSAAQWFMRYHGIGKLRVSMDSEAWRCGVTHEDAPRLNRKALAQRVKDVLTPEHQTFAEAGNNHGARLTHFSMTCRNLARIVANEPGIRLSAAIAQLKHHYHSESTARSCLAKWIEAKSVKDVRMIREGKMILLFPAWHEKVAS